MANFNDLIPKLRINPVNGNVEEEPVVIDDAFDPLFNRRAKATIQNRYGVSPLLTPLYGYTDFLDTVFAPRQDGKWGIMGPAMGILGGFGRTLDKAEDFLLGGLTEGVNAVNQVNPFSTAPATPVNPIRNIFVEDQDYTGEKLFAAMGNSMNKLAGGAVLNETDFQDTTWKPAAFATEIITDPGIAGGLMSKAGVAGAPLLQQITKEGVIDSPVKKVGDLLSSYDDIVTKGAWDVTVPGLRPAIKSHLNKMRQFLAVNSEKAIQNVPLKYKTVINADGTTSEVPDLEDFVTREYFNAHERWQNAVKNSGIMDADPSKMPAILDQLEKELRDIDVVVTKHGLADDEYFEKYAELDNAIREAREILANPKAVDTAEATIQQNIADKVNKILSNEELEKIENARGMQAYDDVYEAYSKAGIIEGPKTGWRFKTPEYESISSNLKEKIKKSPYYYQDIIDDVTTFPETDSTTHEAIIKKSAEDALDAFDEGSAERIEKEINLILDMNYFDDPTISQIASNKLRSILNAKPTKGHKVILSHSEFYNAASQVGDTAVNRIKSIPDLDAKLNNIEEALKKKFLDNMPDVDTRVFKADNDVITYTDAFYKYLDDSKITIFKTMNNFKSALKNPKLTNKEILDKANSLYNALKYQRKKLGYLGGSAEKELNDLLNDLRENVDLGLLGLGGKQLKTSMSKKSIQQGSIQSIANGFNILATKYLDPWVDATGKINLDLYADVKEMLRKNKNIDLFINPSETFDLAEVIKHSRKYNVGDKSVETISNELRDLYNAVIKRGQYAMGPFFTKKFLDNNIGYKTFKDLNANSLKYYEDLLKSRIEKYGSNDELLKKLDSLTKEKAKFEASIDIYSKNFISQAENLTDAVKYQELLNNFNTTIKPFQDSVSEIDANIADIQKQLDEFKEIQKVNDNIKSAIADLNNPFYDKGFDELTDYQKDFVRKMAKDFNIPTRDNYLKWLKENTVFKFNKSKEAYRKVPAYFYAPNSALKKYGAGFKLSGSEVDSFLLGKTTKEKANEVIANTVQTTMKSESTVDVERLKNVLTTLDNTDFSKYMFESASLNTDALKQSILDSVAKDNYSEEAVRDLEWMLNKELSEPYKYIKGDYATTRMKGVQDILKNFDAISQKYGINTADWDTLSDAAKRARYKDFFKHTEMYLSWRDYLNDDIIKGKSFINDLFSSGGISVGIFNKKQNLEAFQAAERAITNNIAVINKQMPAKHPFIQLIEKDLGNNKVLLGYTLNTENLNAIKDFSKIKIDESKLQDIVWALKDEARAKEIYDAFSKEKAHFTFKEMDDLFNKSQDISRDLSRKIGYTEFSDDYFKHAISVNKNAEKWLGSYVYSGINQDDLTDLVQSIQAYQKAGSQKAYGITPLTRKLRGPISNWNNLSPGTYIFSVDPSNIVKKTFSEGIFNNANFQTHIGLFTNDNFKISSYAQNIDDLKEILYVKKNGDFTGNMDNLILAAPKYSKEGRIIGFTQFDKLSDKGLQQALDNPETILVPTHLLAPLDKMLRKDMKMSNKVYAFINKYFTIPVKFGTLTNLGFIVGNMGDAGFKQAVTLSRKYGTSVPYELARVVESVKNTIVLNNKFADTFKLYSSEMEKSMGDKFIAYYGLTDSLISTPKARANFENWIKESVASGKISKGDENVCNLWLFLNNKENTSIFKGDFQNLGDLVQRKSKYAPPKNLVDRLLTGDKVMLDSGDVKTYYGLFAGNPVTNKILNTSGTIESVARSASILNDLTRHYGSKEIYQILGDPETYNKEFRKLNIKALDAINVMSTANFDYNYMNDFTDRFATFVPFPTFVAKNYAYWMDIMVNKPELVDSLINMQEVAWRGKNTENDKFQAEAKGRGAIPLSTSKNSKLKGIFKPTPTQSMFSAFDVMQNPIQNAAFRTHPILHPITHHLQKPEDDKYRPYSTDPYEKNIKRTDPEYNALKATFHRLNPYERTINTWLRTPSKLFSEHNAQASDFVPSVFQPDFSTKSKSKNKKR